MKETLNIAIIGTGGFGKFLLETYKEIPELNIIAISSTNKKNLKELAEKYSIPNYNTDYKKILALPEVDIISLPTPPFLHSEIILDAIKQGKNIICEKPLALNERESNKIKSSLKKSNSHFTINYVLRKNPIFLALKKIISEDSLGKLQSFNFQNYAQLSSLPENHWFWDKKKSGGIWVEHGVHFFDLFYNLLKEKPSLIKSFSEKRPLNKNIEDFVSSSFLYGKTIGTYTHSFTLPQQIEETSFKMIFDRAVVDVSGWIPESISIKCLLTKTQYGNLKKVFPINEFSISSEISETQDVKTRSGDSKADKKINLQIKTKKTKDELYKDSIKKIALDLVNSIKNNTPTEISFDDAYNSLQTALTASKN